MEKTGKILAILIPLLLITIVGAANVIDTTNQTLNETNNTTLTNSTTNSETNTSITDTTNQPETKTPSNENEQQDTSTKGEDPTNPEPSQDSENAWQPNEQYKEGVYIAVPKK